MIRSPMLVIAATVVLLTLRQLPVVAQPAPSRGYTTDDDFAGFSSADFQRILTKLKTEREALDAEWNALSRRLTTPTPGAEPDLDKLKEQLKQTLLRLQKERMASKQPAVVSPMPPILPKQDPPPPAIPKKIDDEPPTSPVASLPITPPAGPVDVLHLAQTLFRAERYEEALAAFRQVDLKGKTADERTPIVYLTASCLQQLGKADEATALLREAANARGDERFSGYAQWQLDVLRWHRETDARFKDLRQRRQSAEKR